MNPSFTVLFPSVRNQEEPPFFWAQDKSGGGDLSGKKIRSFILATLILRGLIYSQLEMINRQDLGDVQAGDRNLGVISI